jgi:predicted DNA-binding transcriptional regulator AlpA
MRSGAPEDAIHDTEGRRLFSLADIATRTGFTKSTLRSWVRAGLVPPGLRFGHRTLRWPESDLDIFRQVAAARRPRVRGVNR